MRAWHAYVASQLLGVLEALLLEAEGQVAVGPLGPPGQGPIYELHQHVQP